ncbi:MAG TPA: glucose-1-phosphate thymidylyltransferase, partial [bacterium]|nr:glucose-1-phosphate thymidylyltransferase [bacterium]
GSQWGLKFKYEEQTEPRGLADAFIVGRNFIGKDPVCLILGDNIFYGQGLPAKLRTSSQLKSGAQIFAYSVRDPQRYGVVEFDEKGKALSIEEKPGKARSRFAVPGLYFYDNQVLEIAANLTPSARGELEITDINRTYMEKDQLHVEVLGRGIAWLDAGTPESLLQAANFIQAVEERQDIIISCPEEIAYRMNYIGRDEIKSFALTMKDNQYGQYLLRLLEDEILPYNNA